MRFRKTTRYWSLTWNVYVRDARNNIRYVPRAETCRAHTIMRRLHRCRITFHLLRRCVDICTTHCECISHSNRHPRDVARKDPNANATAHRIHTHKYPLASTIWSVSQIITVIILKDVKSKSCRWCDAEEDEHWDWEIGMRTVIFIPSVCDSILSRISKIHILNSQLQSIVHTRAAPPCIRFGFSAFDFVFFVSWANRRRCCRCWYAQTAHVMENWMIIFWLTFVVLVHVRMRRYCLIWCAAPRTLNHPLAVPSNRQIDCKVIEQ